MEEFKILMNTDKFVFSFGDTIETRMSETELSLTQFLTYELSCIGEHAILMLQDIELWMLVPCDKDGVVLIKPDIEDYIPVNIEQVLTHFEIKVKEFEKAQERVLFKGFTHHIDEHDVPYLKFEDWDIMPDNDFLGWNGKGEDERYFLQVNDLVYLQPELTDACLKRLKLIK